MDFAQIIEHAKINAKSTFTYYSILHQKVRVQYANYKGYYQSNNGDYENLGVVGPDDKIYMAEGTLLLGPVDGLYALAKYNEEKDLYYGEALTDKELITFTGRTPKDLKRKFKAAIEEYMEMAAQQI